MRASGGILGRAGTVESCLAADVGKYMVLSKTLESYLASRTPESSVMPRPTYTFSDVGGRMITYGKSPKLPQDRNFVALTKAKVLKNDVHDIGYSNAN